MGKSRTRNKDIDNPPKPKPSKLRYQPHYEPSDVPVYTIGKSARPYTDDDIWCDFE